MHRLIAILLIPIFSVGNSFAHSHGSVALASEAHGRAHIHVGNTTHHGANHESRDHAHAHPDHHQHSHDRDFSRDESSSTPVQDPVEHDSDAIYLVSVDLALNCDDRTLVEVDPQPLVHTADFSFAALPAKIRRPQLDHSPPQRQPLYLLNAALRL